MALIYSLHSEILKLLYKRATHIVLFLILVFQTFLANIGASQIVSVGIHATPETNPELAEAIPPIEFLGFDVTLVGVFFMIILGSIYGAEEYKDTAIRTSLLSNTNRSTFLVSKTFIWLIFSFVIPLLQHLTEARGKLPKPRMTHSNTVEAKYFVNYSVLTFEEM